ncbi:MAG: glycosyltransferase family 4 protein [Ardenticatenaceae bacterium]|nr:glycosyltransferase family 4 protein [Ardenticatenaceae bacterium]
MRVALNAHFWGRETTGSGQYLHRLVAAFQAGHPELDLLLIGDAAAAARHSQTPVPLDLKWQTAPTPFDRSSPNLAKVWFEQIAFPRVARGVRADLIHVPYFAPPLFKLKGNHTNRSSIPVVATVHDLIPLLLPEYRGPWPVRGYSQLVARAARRTDLVLTDSQSSCRDARRLLALPPARVRTVYLGVDEHYRPQPPAEINRLRRKLRLPETFVLYLGGFDVRKRVPQLLAAAARSQIAWPLVIAGQLPIEDTAFTPDPRRIATGLNLGERVHFVGWVPETDKPALFSAATLFVFPSRYEGFGLPVLEALACGTPTVTTTAASLPELVDDAAWTVAPADVTALAAAIDTLMHDGERRARLTARGPAQAARFTWQRCASETARAYADVLRAAAAVRPQAGVGK